MIQKRSLKIYFEIRRILFYTLCIALCSYQVINILYAYLSYETSISIEYDNSSQISLPAITICLEKYYILRDEELNESEINEKIRSDRWLLNNYFNHNLTIAQQNQYLLSKNEVFFTDGCSLIETIGVRNHPTHFKSPNDPYLDCERISPILESINHQYKCFTLFNQLEGQPDENFIIDYGDRIFYDQYSEIILISLPIGMHYGTFLFHRRTEQQLRYSTEKTLILDLKENIMTQIFYKKITVKLLPFPFKTNCHEYGDGRTRSSCVAICRRDELIARSGRWPDIYDATNLSTQLPMMRIWGDLTFEEDSDVADTCRKRCGNKLECTQEVFEIDESRLECKWPNKKHPVVIMPPVVSDQVVRYVQRMSMVEMICFIGSLVSLYFGFSFIMLTDITATVIRFFVDNILNVYVTKIKNCWQTNRIQKINVNFNVNRLVVKNEFLSDSGI